MKSEIIRRYDPHSDHSLQQQGIISSLTGIVDKLKKELSSSLTDKRTDEIVCFEKINQLREEN